MTLATFYSTNIPTLTSRYRYPVAGAAYALGAALAQGENAGQAITRLTGLRRYINPLNASAQLAAYQSITGP